MNNRQPAQRDTSYQVACELSSRTEATVDDLCTALTAGNYSRAKLRAISNWCHGRDWAGTLSIAVELVLRDRDDEENEA